VSFSTLLHVLNNSKAKKSHRLVLIEIANHVNEKNGLAWPSHREIGNKTGLSRRRIVDIIADLKALGELEVFPHGSPTGGFAYRIPCATIAHPPRATIAHPYEKNDTKGVQPLHTESYIESISENRQNLKKHLTHDEAVSLGLTPGSLVFRIVTGEAEEEE
jgi:hypothetical protein